MKTIVTGGAGFIGSHLVESLLHGNHQVVVLDDFSTGRLKNLDQVRSHPGFVLHRVDITKTEHILPYFKEIDWVFHLAGRADIVPSIQRPMEYHRVNVDGTVSVLEASRRAGVSRFIYSASSSCYGIPDIFPTPETAPARPEYPYAFTKYAGEQYVMHWGKVYKLPVVSLRLFNVYGPRSRTSGTYGAVFGVFLAQKLNKMPFTVVGDGTQKRDFIFVTDVVNAFIMAAASPICNQAINVGSSRPQSVNRLVELLGGDVVHVPKRPGEPERTHADISRITALLDWRPRVPFEEGVKRLFANSDYWREAPVWTPESIEKATKEWFTNLGG